MGTVVVVTKSAAKELLESPDQVQSKFALWQILLQAEGLRTVRKRPGFHDEPLKGSRKGERSVRLNRKWRAIYRESEEGKLIIVEVTEVTPHEY